MFFNQDDIICMRHGGGSVPGALADEVLSELAEEASPAARRALSEISKLLASLTDRLHRHRRGHE